MTYAYINLAIQNEIVVILHFEMWHIIQSYVLK